MYRYHDSVIRAALSVFLPFVCLIVCFARPASSNSSYAGEFLALGAGARAVALGGAYTAIVDDATAGYWNAAALTNIRERQAHTMHSKRFGGLVEHSFLALANNHWPKAGNHPGASRLRCHHRRTQRRTKAPIHHKGREDVPPRLPRDSICSRSFRCYW